MSPSKLVSKLEHGIEESQNQCDARVEHLWAKLDPTKTGELDFKGLQKGFKKIDHRAFHLALKTAPFSLAKTAVSHEECRWNAS